MNELLLALSLVTIHNAQAQTSQSDVLPPPIPGINTSINSQTGLAELYGCDPEKSASICFNRKIDFNPEYFSVIYMKFHKKGFESRHAYFKMIDSKLPDDVACAVKYLRKNKNKDKCGVVTPPTIAVNRRHPLERHRYASGGRGRYKHIRNNFDGSIFGSQQNVYVFVDNKNIKFNDITPMSFTTFGAYDEIDNRHPTRVKNTTVFDAELKSFWYKKNKKIDVLFFKNYFLDEDGNLISNVNQKNTTYSINYNLLMCVNSKPRCNPRRVQDKNPGNIIPILIDPDTGNGWGSRP